MGKGEEGKGGGEEEGVGRKRGRESGREEEEWGRGGSKVRRDKIRRFGKG
jgi:hypothetical protein